VETVRIARAGDEGALGEIMEASLATDRIPGFVRADIDRVLVRFPANPGGTVVALEGDRIVGYATPRHDDLTVLPERRRRGHGRRLVAAALDLERAAGHDTLQFYFPPHLPASVAFAEALGFRYQSSLWQFQLAPGAPVPPPAFGDHVVLRRFDPAVDTDFDAWAAFMQAAFEGHPTPMRWTPEIVRHVHTATDFDPDDILKVFAVGEPDRPIAFTRIESFRDDETREPYGEVGLIGVMPAWRRRGLGRELLRWGVAELRSRGAGRIDLSVEAENERATALYRAHGFEPAIEWPHWVRSTR
jgi:mycothiol synthase